MARTRHRQGQRAAPPAFPTAIVPQSCFPGPGVALPCHRMTCKGCAILPGTGRPLMPRSGRVHEKRRLGLPGAVATPEPTEHRPDCPRNPGQVPTVIQGLRDQELGSRVRAAAVLRVALPRQALLGSRHHCVLRSSWSSNSRTRQAPRRFHKLPPDSRLCREQIVRRGPSPVSD